LELIHISLLIRPLCHWFFQTVGFFSKSLSAFSSVSSLTALFIQPPAELLDPMPLNESIRGSVTGN